jgi:5-methylcytosine-specific restriction enzyme A
MMMKTKGDNMPSLPPRPCTAPRCTAYATKGARCANHQPEPWVSSAAKSRHERGYGCDWVKIRSQRLAIDDHMCQICLSMGRYTMASQVDHVINKASGGTDHINNLQSVCAPCHKLKTQSESGAKRTGSAYV